MARTHNLPQIDTYPEYQVGNPNGARSQPLPENTTITYGCQFKPIAARAASSGRTSVGLSSPMNSATKSKSIPDPPKKFPVNDRHCGTWKHAADKHDIQPSSPHIAGIHLSFVADSVPDFLDGRITAPANTTVWDSMQLPGNSVARQQTQQQSPNVIGDTFNRKSCRCESCDPVQKYTPCERQQWSPSVTVAKLSIQTCSPIQQWFPTRNRHGNLIRTFGLTTTPHPIWAPNKRSKNTFKPENGNSPFSKTNWLTAYHRTRTQTERPGSQSPFWYDDKSQGTSTRTMPVRSEASRVTDVGEDVFDSSIKSFASNESDKRHSQEGRVVSFQ